MKLTSSNGHITIHGNIKSVAHYHTISSEINSLLRTFNHIKIELLDSISITSSVIGYLCKIAELNYVSFEMHIKDQDLYALLDELGLQKVLNIQQINI